jgi:hypothetical protein
VAQTKIGDCEVCTATSVAITLRHSSIWFCEECWSKEQAMQQENTRPEEEARNIDQSVQVRTDLFNAATVAIVDLKKSIDENVEIQNKPYALAQALLERFTHFKTVGFQLQEQLVDVNTNQRAIQTYLNNMANQLRAEEREKLKIHDINYRPQPVKTPSVKTIKTVGTSSKKAGKKEIAAAAKELGIAEFTLTAFVLQSGGDLDVAVKKIKASIEAAKQVK